MKTSNSAKTSDIKKNKNYEEVNFKNVVNKSTNSKRNWPDKIGEIKGKNKWKFTDGKSETRKNHQKIASVHDKDVLNSAPVNVVDHKTKNSFLLLIKEMIKDQMKEQITEQIKEQLREKSQN